VSGSQLRGIQPTCALLLDLQSPEPRQHKCLCEPWFAQITIVTANHRKTTKALAGRGTQ
jgi:hypothetical protein